MNDKTARLIITLDCNRDCHYCCNTPEMLASAKRIKDLSELNEYPTICVTGGEPMLYPEETCNIIKDLNRPNRKIYLYTALATTITYLHRMLFLDGLDGIHYTLHYNSEKVDITEGVINLERLSINFPSKSFRMYIDPEIKSFVRIRPYLWKRIEVKPWIDDAPLPENEDLFILED